MIQPALKRNLQSGLSTNISKNKIIWFTMANSSKALNSYASTLRTQADMEYLLARLAYRSQILSQFRWCSLHALEKYLKSIVVLSRVKSANKLSHKLEGLLVAINTSNSLKINLSQKTSNFLSYLDASSASDRYAEFSWVLTDFSVIDLDRAVWEIRRFCNSELYEYHNDEATFIFNSSELFLSLTQRSRENTIIKNGYLENIIYGKNCFARAGLTWSNFYYSLRRRKSVKFSPIIQIKNSIPDLYPSLNSELSKYLKSSKRK